MWLIFIILTIPAKEFFAIIQEDLKRMLKKDVKEIQNLLHLLSSNWETLNADTKDWESSFQSPEFIGAWNEHRKIYGYVLRSELVYQFKNLLTQEENIKIDGPISHLIIDEYQDLNRCDQTVIKEISKKGALLFCAGDDDQSIYGFRYANPEGIRRFKNDYSDSDQFNISECRRCDKNILDLSLSVIRQDYNRIPKKLVSVTGNPGEYHLLRFDNQNEEAEKISNLIISLNKKEIDYNEIIILLRSDNHGAFSRVLIEKLKNKNIPINQSGNIYELFDSNEGRYLVAILKLLKNKNNDIALRTILQCTGGIGVKSLESLYVLAKEKNIRYNVLIDNIFKGIEIINNKQIKEAIINIYGILTDLSVKEYELDALIDYLVSKIPNSNALFNDNIQNFVSKNSIKSVDDFISSIIDIIGPQEPFGNSENSVRIMTMHQAKGLTAKAVFVVAVEEEYIPGRSNPDEERRLLYVSLTRARHYLFLTYCVYRYGQQQHTGYKAFDTPRRNLSRFIKDLPIIKPVNGNNFDI